MNETLIEAMRKVEAAHFRTVSDTGASPQALTVWNALRAAVGLPRIWREDLPEWDAEKKQYVRPERSNLL